MKKNNENIPLFKKRRFRMGLTATLVSVILVTGVYFISRYLAGQELQADPQKAAEADIAKTIKQVGKLMLLPEGEIPTLASVADPAKLSTQQFFKNAQVGDKVLIYNKARKAILYRPVSNLIIEVAPINIATQTAQMQITSAPNLLDRSYGFVIRNGTEVNGLTKTYQKELETKLPKAEIIGRDNSPDNYDQTMLVGISDSGNRVITELSEFLGIKASGLPKGETAPVNADFLIILGRDKVN